MSEKLKHKFDTLLDRMFEEEQAKLPPEDRCARTAQEMCRDEHDGYKCTKAKGHAGQHIAHERLGTAMTRW